MEDYPALPNKAYPRLGTLKLKSSPGVDSRPRETAVFGLPHDIDSLGHHRGLGLDVTLARLARLFGSLGCVDPLGPASEVRKLEELAVAGPI